MTALTPDPPDGAGIADGRTNVIGRRTLAVEVWLVLGLSLGTSAVYAMLDLVRGLTSGRPLHAQTAVLNATVATSSLLDLAYQLVGIAAALVPVALVGYLLVRSGESFPAIGLDGRRPQRELLWGVGLAAGVGGLGLALYVGAFRSGLSVRVIPTTLPDVWWRIPVLLLDALQNGLLEEVVISGYLLHRLEQLSWGKNRSLLTSAVIRGSYHLYQGFGGFVGNLAMGLLFGRLYQRQRRLPRLVLAHTLIDAGAFIGYVVLKGKVSWLP